MDAIEIITPEQIKLLESAVDRMQEELPELRGFILPGGNISASWSHLARTVCRRSERRMVRFLEEMFPTHIPNSYQQALRYVNRLSDYFFALARYCNYITGVPEMLWKI
jgi:cob(I)alamin adenosyltransferase